MKAAGNPWMKFYPSDWRADPALRSCTIAARGLWIEMLALMHEAEPYGSLLINGTRIDKKRLAALAGIRENECTVLMLELEGFGVFSRDENGTIYSRRMRRDAAKAIKDKENGRLGGNPTVKAGVNPQVKPEVKAQKPEARSHIPESISESARSSVSGSEKALRSDLMEIFPGAANYDRTTLWLEKGYAPGMILEVVKDVLARGKSVESLSYFDAALAERHAARAETPHERAAAGSELDLDKMVAFYAKTGKWSRYAGPEPGQVGCRASPELLAKHGFGIDGLKIRTLQAMV